MSTELPAFVLPGLSNNADAWGPNCSDVSVKNDDALFQPYSKDNKSERHWKISDWTVNSKGRSTYFAFLNLILYRSFGLIQLVLFLRYPCSIVCD